MTDITPHLSSLRFYSDNPIIRFFPSLLPFTLPVTAITILFAEYSKVQPLKQQFVRSDCALALKLVPELRWRWEREGNSHVGLSQLASKIMPRFTGDEAMTPVLLDNKHWLSEEILRAEVLPSPKELFEMVHQRPMQPGGGSGSASMGASSSTGGMGAPDQGTTYGPHPINGSAGGPPPSEGEGSHSSNNASVIISPQDQTMAAMFANPAHHPSSSSSHQQHQQPPQHQQHAQQQQFAQPQHQHHQMAAPTPINGMPATIPSPQDVDMSGHAQQYAHSQYDPSWLMAPLRDDPTVHDLWNSVPYPQAPTAYEPTAGGSGSTSAQVLEAQQAAARAAAGHVPGGVDPTARFDTWHPHFNAREGWREVYGNNYYWN